MANCSLLHLKHSTSTFVPGLKRFCTGRQLEQCVNCSSSSHPFNSEPAGPFDDVVDDDDDDNDNFNSSAMMMVVSVIIAELKF